MGRRISGGGAERRGEAWEPVAGDRAAVEGAAENGAGPTREPQRLRAAKGAGLALGLALLVSLGLGLSDGGDAAAGASGGKTAATASGAIAAGTVTDDGTEGDAGGSDGGAEGRAKGDGSAPAEVAPIEVKPTDITADSLISRHQAAPRDPHKGPVTNLPLPRYVSLKGGEGNARRGPSLSHRIDWVFRHPGMPLRVIAEFGHWRRVEDQDGAGGWVHYSLLSGVRTAIVMTDMAELRTRADKNATVIARAEAGAIVRLHECTKDWCRVSGGGEKGWVPKTSLWGADADEIRD